MIKDAHINNPTSFLEMREFQINSCRGLRKHGILAERLRLKSLSRVVGDSVLYRSQLELASAERFAASYPESATSRCLCSSSVTGAFAKVLSPHCPERSMRVLAYEQQSDRRMCRDT
jgi:hypothetical protein